MDWDTYYLSQAAMISRRSKDPNTQVGGLIVTPDHQVAGGYNGLPFGIKEWLERWERPTKYRLVIHAEMNALLSAAKSGVQLRGSTLYITMMPCSNCALHVIQAGVKRVVYFHSSLSDAMKKACDLTPLLFAEAGIELLAVERPS